MTILTTNNEILMHALDIADENQSAASDFYQPAIRYYNDIHRQICKGGVALNPDVDEKWLWLRSLTPGVITLQPAFISTGDLTFNSDAVNLDDPPAYSLTGWIFRATDQTGDYFRVLAHTAGAAALTLDSVYTGETVANAEIKAFKLIYDLPDDVEEIIGAMRGPRNTDKIEGIDIDRMYEDYPYSEATVGVPKAYAMLTDRKIQFSGYAGDESSDIIRLEYDYNRKATDLADDGGEPLVPLPFRASVLANFVAYYILDSKHDTKADRIGQLAQAGLIAMRSENVRRMQQQGSDSFGQIYPRSARGQRGRRVLKTAGGIVIP